MRSADCAAKLTASKALSTDANMDAEAAAEDVEGAAVAEAEDAIGGIARMTAVTDDAKMTVEIDAAMAIGGEMTATEIVAIAEMSEIVSGMTAIASDERVMSERVTVSVMRMIRRTARKRMRRMSEEIMRITTGARIIAGETIGMTGTIGRSEDRHSATEMAAAEGSARGIGRRSSSRDRDSTTRRRRRWVSRSAMCVRLRRRRSRDRRAMGRGRDTASNAHRTRLNNAEERTKHAGGETEAEEEAGRSSNSNRNSRRLNSNAALDFDEYKKSLQTAAPIRARV